MALLHQKFPPDIRVEKEALSLAQAGHNVFVLTLKIDGQLDFENFEGFYIVRLNLLKRHRFIIRFFFTNLISLYQIPKIVKKYNIGVLHVHEITYALLVVILGKLLRKKVVFDVHEYYVSSAEADLKKKGVLGQFFLGFMKLSEKMTCRLASKVVVATWGLAERLDRLGVSRDKIVTILNVANIEMLKKVTTTAVREKKFKEKFVVSYVGGFSTPRGLDTLIRALPLVVREVPNVHILLVGDGDAKESLVELCQQLDLMRYVTFTGRVSFRKAMEYVQISDLGVIPYHSTPQTEVAIPHKIFQYMYFEKPVIVSSVRSLKKIVKETKCGMVFRTDDYEMLAKKIIDAAQNPMIRREMGEMGRFFVEKEYNWEIEKRKFLPIYS